MSAWLCTDTHISAIVQQAVVEGVIAPVTADQMWQRMKWENLYALHMRYGDELVYPEWQMVPVERTTTEAPLFRAAIWKHCRCWMYQCAEYEGYDEEYGYRLVQELCHKIELDLLGDKIAFRADPEAADRAYTTLSNMADLESPTGHAWGIASWDEVIDHSQMGATTP